jgi:hypothetical protein
MQYMLQRHVSDVLKQSQRSVMKLNEPDLKVSSVCNKAYQMYEQCTVQTIPDASVATHKTRNRVTLQHFVHDLEYYHTTTMSVEQQMEVGNAMLNDPFLRSNKLMNEYSPTDLERFKAFVQEVKATDA